MANEDAMTAYEKAWRKNVQAAAPGAVGLVSDLIDAIAGASKEYDCCLSVL